jgi:hypothetical protein
LGETTLAAEQAQRALEWAASLEARNPERALIWGLAELYLQHQKPQIALQFLDRWREPTGWRQQVRNLWRETIDDDGLRNRRLRLHALLQLETQQTQPTDATGTAAETSSPARATTTPADHNPTKEIPALLRTLRRAALQLLEGEALIHFYIDGLLRPLLAAGRQTEAWALLPDLRAALLRTSGNKHTVRVGEVTQLLGDQQSPQIDGFLRDLWRESAPRGLWQTVHSIEGALPLILAQEGPNALVALAHSSEQT